MRADLEERKTLLAELSSTGQDEQNGINRTRLETRTVCQP